MTSTRTCERTGCTEPLPVVGHGRIPRFCSTRCRVASHRAKQRPPAELTASRRWVRHSETKVPLTTTGAPASSTDPATWSSYTDASRSKAGTGVGCVLNGDGVVCIDLDHCLSADGRLTAWAADILARTPRTWIEISPSGTGLHIWGRADVPSGRRLRADGRHIEFYGSGRYITVTGRRYDSAPTELADLGALIASLT
jgi:primase-polymerase (primpol)-like protein